MNNLPAIEVCNLSKSYIDSAETSTQVLKNLSLTIHPGEIVAIVGSSGSGKSTLLHAIGGLDQFDSGTVKVKGVDISRLTEKERGRLRNEQLGFVYQFHHLLPEFTALENVAMPLIIRRTERAQAFERAKAILCAVGLEHRLSHLPCQMSGGERQRTAIARAIVTSPACVLADEPTGNLDHETALSVFARFVELAHTTGAAVVIVTHDQELARLCDRTVQLKEGQIINTLC